MVASALVCENKSADQYNILKNINVLQELWHSQWDKRTVAVHQAGTIKNELPETVEKIEQLNIQSGRFYTCVVYGRQEARRLL